jgi:Ca-activated chloride channel family protein
MTKPTRREWVTAVARWTLSAATVAQGVPVAAASAVLQEARRATRLFRGSAELVPTAVTVRDGAGRVVTGLGQDDFVITESGRPQPITQFTGERVPASVALVLDVSDSMRGPRMDDARTAVRVFVDTHLHPEDEVALFVFNHEARMLADWTADRQSILDALAPIRPSGGTGIYDAVSAALPTCLQRRHPRSAMIVVSDGADTSSDASLVQLKQQLSRADVCLYGIAVDTPGMRDSQRVSPQVFRELAAQGAGYAEVVSSTAEIAPAIARIADELNAQYLMAYTPETPGDGAFRPIRVTVPSRPGLAIRARRGVVR